jgi:hypothetical protein
VFACNAIRKRDEGEKSICCILPQTLKRQLSGTDPYTIEQK